MTKFKLIITKDKQYVVTVESESSEEIQSFLEILS